MISSAVQAIRRELFDRFVLKPSRDEIDFRSQRRELLEFDGQPLETFFQSNCGAEPHDEVDLLVLKFPGTAGRAERSSEFPMSMLPDLRVAMWTWNPPGYGQSKGRASFRNIAEASLEFWRQVAEPQVRTNTTIWLCGNSLGCATAMNVASQVQSCSRPCGLLLRNPPPLKPVFRRVAGRYPLGWLVFPCADTLVKSMDAVRTASKIQWPAVFLQSELDTLVPTDMQQRIIDEYQGQHRAVLMKGLAHDGLPTETHEPDILDAVIWLRQQTIAR